MKEAEDLLQAQQKAKKEGIEGIRYSQDQGLNQ